MEKKHILNILFWTALAIVIALILWRIFGNSPSDLSIMISALFAILLKMWAISDELKEFKHEIRFSFHKAKEDISKINQKLAKGKK